MLSDNPIFRRFWAFQYNGTGDVAAIVASANEWQTARGGFGVVWDCPASDAGSMVLRRTDAMSNMSYLTVPAGYWLLCNGDDGPSDVVTDQFYARVYRKLTEIWMELTAATRLMADPAFVAAMRTATMQVSFLGTGVGKLNAILVANATANVDCQVRPQLPAGVTGAVVRADAIVAGLNVLSATNQGNVAAAGGVTAHTLVRVSVQNATLLGIALGTPVVLATVHV